MNVIKKKLNSDKSFVSDIDKFLINFDKQHPQQSISQVQEIEQYQVLMTKRDIKN